MSTAVQELKDKIEFDVLRRINDLERDVRHLRNKVLYDVPSKSQRVQENTDDCESTRVDHELVSELKLQNALLKSQVNEVKKLLLAFEKGAAVEQLKETDGEGYW